MSTAATVPVFDPQGVLRDVPQDQFDAAVKAGGMPAVKFQAPDKSIRFVPASRTQDAVKAGGTLLPYEQQEVKHPGFWHNIASDLAGIAQSVPGLAMAGISGNAVNLPGTIANMSTEIAANDAARKQEGRSTAYRIASPIVQGTTGANVRGMEESANQGDIGGVLGHAAAVPAAMAATAGLSAAGEKISGVTEAASNVTNHPVTKFAGQVVDVASFNRIGKLLEAWKQMRTSLEPKGTYPGARFPENPPPELLQANALAQGARSVSDPAAGLGNIPNKYTPPPAPDAALTSPSRSLPGQIGKEVIRPPASPIPPRQGLLLSGDVQAPAPTPEAAPSEPTPAGSGIPRTFQGESALRQVLTGQDNKALIQIAKSRGLDVTKEAQLKPGVGDKLLVNKIINDFSPEELQEVRDQYIENSRFRHSFGEIGDEAWRTLNLKTYFPDMKIAATRLGRLAKSTSGSSVSPQSPPPTVPATEDLTGILEESVKRARRQ